MIMLASLEETKARLRIVHDAEDADIEMMIQAASQAVVTYLGVEGTASFRDTAGDFVEDTAGIILDVPPVVKQAAIALTGYFYKDRDSDEDKAWQPGYLPAPVTALLYPLRDPALA